jgi:hypothetical protein
MAEPPELHSAPDSCEPADTIPGAPAHRKPDTHRAASAVRRGQVGTLTPGLPHTTSDAMAASMRTAFAQTA